MVARARVDEVDARQVPARHAQSELDESAVRRGQLEAHAFDRGGAVAAALHAGDLGAEAAAELVGARALAADGGAAEVALERRLLDLAVLLAVVLVLDPGLRGGVEQLEGERLLALEHGHEPALDSAPQNDSCLPFCSGEYGSVVWCTMLRRSRPSTVSAASIAEPLSVSSARGRPRFWNAWRGRG